MNEIMPRGPLFGDRPSKRPAPQRRVPPRNQAWSVASMVMSASQGLQRLFASSGDPDIHRP